MEIHSGIFLGIWIIMTELTVWTMGFRCERCRDADVCETVTGTLRYSVMSKGYNPVVTIPRGACYINVTEAGQSKNVLAFKSRGEYVINGHWRTSPMGEYQAAGTVFLYRKSEDPCPGECIWATGPTLAAVNVQLLYHDRNPGVHYSYQVARHLKVLPDQPEPEVLTSGDRSELREAPTGYSDLINKGDYSNEQKGNFPEFVPIPGGSSVHHRGPIFSSDFAHRRQEGHEVPDKRPVSGDIPRRQELRDVTYSRGEDDEHINRVESVNDNGKFTSTRDITNHDMNSNSLDRSSNGLVSELQNYAWRIQHYTECTRPCGGGMQESVYGCVDMYTGILVQDSYCTETIKPDTRHRVCNTEPCTPKWVTGTWSSCTASCGTGYQSRDVTCQQRISATDYQHIGDSYCTSVKPEGRRECYKAKCYSWSTGNWGKCSVECGVGTRRRSVQCRDDSGLVVNDDYCDSQSAPSRQESCDAGYCGHTEWFFGQWTDKCSENCGIGVVTRPVFCVSEHGHVINDVMCDAASRPEWEKVCREETLCSGEWFTGPWSECSQSCGEGVQTRQVFCLKKIGEHHLSLPDDECHHKGKPDTSRNCSETSCGHMWFQTHWSQCSRSCDGGVQSRDVICLATHETSNGTCKASYKPQETQECNTVNCWRGSSICQDKYPNCAVVVEASLCRYPYYQRKCCRSCSGFTRRRRK